MGGICSRGQVVAGDEEDRIVGQELERRIKTQNEADKEVVKLLLLGAGESGKSTIFKQMKVLYQTGFNENELKNYAPVIHANLYQSMKALYDGCIELAADDDTGKYEMQPENKVLGKRLSEIEDNGDYPVLDTVLGEAIEKVWKDAAIQATCMRGSQFQLPDCAQYFLDNVRRLSQPDYTPTKEDVLHARVRTTGIADMEFGYKKVKYRLFDVGGQRNERRKWINLFDGVTAVIFCAALSEYDQFLFEDESKNRMVETRELFNWLLQEPSFKKTAFLVFLNKFDIFEKKVPSVPLNVCEWFKDYKPTAVTGQAKVQHAYEYIEQKFRDVYEMHTPGLGNQRLCKIYKTTALDPNLVKETFELVKRSVDLIILEQLERVLQ